MVTSQELALVETALLKAVESDVDLLCGASQSIVRSGGKRLRPKIVLLGYECVGGQDVAQAVPVAAAVELLHTASLVHDDINDRSSMRRGQQTVNARLGNDLALLIGDFVFVKLLALIATFDSRVIRVLSDACTAIVEGETMQMSHLGDLGMTEATYLEIVRRKTASLFSTCAQVGGYLGGATEEQISALAEYGLNLGMAFQLRDDMLDLIGKEGDLGKPIASDLGQGKMNLAALFALQRIEGALEVLRSRNVPQIVQLLDETGAIQYAVDRTAGFAARAAEALSVLPESETQADLCRLADFAGIRTR